MEGISSWVSQVIIAVMIGTIIEMILPKGNNKKYIKIVIGVYILFTILSPAITNAFQENLEVNTEKYEEYLKNSEEYVTLSEKFSQSTDISIENTYKTALKQDIESKLKEKGYVVYQINLEVELESEERYGYINTMELEIGTGEQEEVSEKKENTININKVEIGKQTTQTKKASLSQSEKMELLQYLSEEYGVNPDNVTII